ncbi:hypothetical protein LCGC14_2292540 [marine sediment metagenome]|uniref:DNA recombination and repair protein Rad51-like C-terminal domain-containing protein n=1 Tax=marine sediment metagenome TaxID=412755 RepID=A0A0F9CQS4_9ZZZZ
MVLKTIFLKGLKELFSFNNVISVSGGSGSGKTNLTLHLIGDLLTYGSFSDSCIWIQASELFPSGRLKQIFEIYPDKLKYIQENIFILPKDHNISDYLEQENVLAQLIAPNTVLPPDLRYIVIDNISHQLRFEVSNSPNVSKVVSCLDSFYTKQLYPLIVFCIRNNFILFLLHEVTYDPHLTQTRPFFYKLYDKLGTIDIILHNNKFNTKRKKREILFNHSKKTFQYTIEQRGIRLL